MLLLLRTVISVCEMLVQTAWPCVCLTYHWGDRESAGVALWFRRWKYLCFRRSTTDKRWAAVIQRNRVQKKSLQWVTLYFDPNALIQLNLGWQKGVITERSISASSFQVSFWQIVATILKIKKKQQINLPASRTWLIGTTP